MNTRIEKLTKAQTAQMDAWADRWIEIGLRTGDADRPRFEAAVADCYRFANLAPPKIVVWVPSPLVAVMAGTLAAQCMSTMRGAVSDAVSGAVSDAVSGAVSIAVDGAVRGAVDGAVNGAVDGAVSDAVSGAVDVEVTNYIGGQFWCGGWYYGVAFTSFFREICQLKLAGDIWARARAYEATVESACWWWPHEQFVMVSERPIHIHRELTNSALPRGRRSHRLHSAVGPAVLFRDGFSVWSWHGVRVTEQIIMRPKTLTADQIAREPNAQVRQVMVERIGIERVCQMFKAQAIDTRGDYELLLLDLGDGRKRPYLKMLNPSVPGMYHIEGVHPNCKTVQRSINWRAGNVETDWQPEILT